MKNNTIKLVIPLFLLVITTLSVLGHYDAEGMQYYPNNGKPDFHISILGIDGASNTATIYEGNIIRIKTLVTNYGSAGTLKLEAGVYKKDTINSWYLNKVLYTVGIAESIPNCITGEDNVDSKQLSLNAKGQSGSTSYVDFYVKTPLIEPIDEANFGVHVQSFNNCWAYGVNTGQTDFKVRAINLLESGGFFANPAPSCSDHILNQDETGIDCGGACGSSCTGDVRCNTDADCASGLLCKNGWDSNLRCIPTSTPSSGSPPAPVPVTNPVLPLPPICTKAQIDASDTTCRNVSCTDPQSLTPCRNLGVTLGIIQWFKEGGWLLILIALGIYMYWKKK